MELFANEVRCDCCRNPVEEELTIQYGGDKICYDCFGDSEGVDESLVSAKMLSN